MNRRRFLATITAIGAAGLAGCTEDSVPPEVRKGEEELREDLDRIDSVDDAVTAANNGDLIHPDNLPDKLQEAHSNINEYGRRFLDKFYHSRMDKEGYETPILDSDSFGVGFYRMEDGVYDVRTDIDTDTSGPVQTIPEEGSESWNVLGLGIAYAAIPHLRELHDIEEYRIQEFEIQVNGVGGGDGGYMETEVDEDDMQPYWDQLTQATGNGVGYGQEDVADLMYDQIAHDIQTVE